MDNEKHLNPSVEFAGDIIRLTIENDLENIVIVNGLAIATAAILMDTSIDSSGVVEEQALVNSVQAYLATFDSALAFAKNSVENSKEYSQ